MASPAPGEAATSLTIEVRSEPQARATTWTLTCDPVGGDHPQAAAACTSLERANEPFAPVPRNQVCTMILGGEDTATVTGTFDGEQINTTFNLRNGCEMGRWNKVAPLLGQQPQGGGGIGTTSTN